MPAVCVYFLGKVPKKGSLKGGGPAVALRNHVADAMGCRMFRSLFTLLLSFTLLQGFAAPATTVCPPGIFAQLGIDKPEIHIVIEGAGDVVERFYLPALKKVAKDRAHDRKLFVTFTDVSRPGEPAQVAEKRARIRKSIEDAGFNYLDKGVPADLAKYNQLDPEYVALATPSFLQTKMIDGWNQRGLKPIRILTEKPLEGSLKAARELEDSLPAFNDGVMAMDHYRPKLDLDDRKVAEIEKYLGGVKGFEATITEDRSGWDKQAAVVGDNQRDGAIEREGRSSVLRDGLATDLVPHALAMLDYFGNVDTLRPTEVKAGRYTGVDGDPNKPTDIGKDTFFAANFLFRDRAGRLVDGRIVTGKGLRVKKYGPETEGNTKMLELTGRNGNRVLFDLRKSGEGASTATYFKQDGTVEKTVKIEANPYEAMFAGVVDGKSHTNGYAFPVETGVIFREKLDHLLSPLERQAALPLYEGGMGGAHERPSPYVEDLWIKLPALSGPNAPRPVAPVAKVEKPVVVDRDFLMIGGTGVMGKGFSHRIANVAGMNLVIRDPNPKAKDIIAGMGEKANITLAEDLAAAVKSLKKPRRMLVLVPNVKILEATLLELKGLLEPGDIVVDGGNSNWKETERRQKMMAEKGIHLVGMGVSGGERGAWNGSSMMVGGSPEAWKHLQPIFTKIAASVPSLDNPAEQSPSVSYIGPGGAGHFVKMTHNGIEYVEMQLLAESYQMMKDLGGMSNTEMREEFTQWNGTGLNSFLLGSAAKVVGHPDAMTGNALVEMIKRQAKQKGTGQWASEAALSFGAYTPTLPEAVFARNATSQSSNFDGIRHELTGPTPSPLSAVEKARLKEIMPKAMYAARMLDFAQGMNLIDMASKENFEGKVDAKGLTNTWRTGSILQGKMLDEMYVEYAKNPGAKTPLDSAELRKRISENEAALRETVEIARRHGVPTPAFSSLLNYYDTVRSEKLPANFIQGLRDYFGGHTFERTDMDGVFHDSWGDPSEGTQTQAQSGGGNGGGGN